MHLALVANDTRGGVQPYLALGRGLLAAGHTVRVITPENFRPLVEASGLELAPLSGDVEAAARELAARAGGAGWRGMAVAREALRGRTVGWAHETVAGAEGADAIVAGLGGLGTGRAAAERLGIPFVEAHLQPLGAPATSYPGALFGAVLARIGPVGRRLTHVLTGLAAGMATGPALQAAREALGLRGRPAPLTTPILYGFSRHVVPVPAGGRRERHVTGWWFLPRDDAWRPDPELERFLGDGADVVSIGFGSMSTEDPATTTRLVSEAVRSVGARAVLLRGWGGLEAIDDEQIRVADAVPHDWLFERVAATVHHGGAGTTGAAAHAGRPTLVVPFAVDQPFWGARLAALGVAPPPIPRRALTADRLARALERMLTERPMRDRAAELGERLAAEDGVGAAVEVLETTLAGGRTPLTAPRNRVP